MTGDRDFFSPLNNYIKNIKMIQIQILRNNKDLVIDGLRKKNFNNLDIVDDIILLDEKYRTILKNIEDLKFKLNTNNTIIKNNIKGNKDDLNNLIVHNKVLKLKIKELEDELIIKDEIVEKLLTLPNLPHNTVPNGNTSEDNEIIKENLTFLNKNKGKHHLEIAKELNLLSLDLGNKLTGSGFPVYIGKGAKLKRALIQYFLDYNIDAGYIEYSVPHLVNKDTAYGTCQLPDKEDQMYYLEKDKLYLIPTAEVPLTNIYRNDIIKPPIKLTGFTPCFRREAGDYGADVRGLNRVHQFDKVEIVKLVEPDKSYDALNEMVDHVENILINLELPYRIIKLCGGDMGFASALTYDFEVWSVVQNKWLEVSSVSNFETFQSNRMMIRYDDNGKNKLVHTLNGSALALPRIIACILENNQIENKVKLPKCLVNYFGNEYII